MGGVAVSRSAASVGDAAVLGRVKATRYAGGIASLRLP